MFEDFLSKRFDEWLTESNLILPKKAFQNYLAIIKNTADAKTYQEFLKNLEKSKNRDLFKYLFWEELAFTLARNPKTLKEYTSFFRGKNDILRAKRANTHLHNIIESKVKITEELLSRIIHDNEFENPPKKILEIGGAWGATIKHLTERYKPNEYQNYEIDGAYAKWAEETFGAKSMPVDGETLSATEDKSMDLVIANNVLFFVPPIKVWSYLTEMARVCNHNGIVIFNLFIADKLELVHLENLLYQYFPRRVFSLIPQRFIDLSFPKEKFQLLRTELVQKESTYLPYLVYKRL